jgi:hypothetical protein
MIVTGVGVSNCWISNVRGNVFSGQMLKRSAAQELSESAAAAGEKPSQNTTRHNEITANQTSQKP